MSNKGLSKADDDDDDDDLRRDQGAEVEGF